MIEHLKAALISILMFAHILTPHGNLPNSKHNTLHPTKTILVSKKPTPTTRKTQPTSEHILPTQTRPVLGREQCQEKLVQNYRTLVKTCPTQRNNQNKKIPLPACVQNFTDQLKQQLRGC